MSSHQLIRRECESRYPELAQLIACYLHQDWPVFHSSPEAAMAEGVSGCSRGMRATIQSELQSLLQSVEDDTRLRSIVSYGLGANIGFKKARDARVFLEDLQRELSK